MTDKRISELDELTAIDGDDLLAVVDDPAGTPVTKKIKYNNLVAPVPAWISHLHEPDDNPAWAEEFDNPGGFAPDWVTITASGTATWTQKRSLASVAFESQSGGSTSAILYPYALPIGYCIETFVRVLSLSASHLMAGPMLSDGVLTDSSCVWLMPYTNTNFSLRAGTIGNINTTLRQTAFRFIDRGELYMRIVHEAANTWRAYGSCDGISWSDFGLASASRTITPTHAGLAVSTWGHSVTRIASFEYLRAYDLS